MGARVHVPRKPNTMGMIADAFRARLTELQARGAETDRLIAEAHKDLQALKESTEALSKAAEAMAE